MKDLKVVFMGTPGFSVPLLKALIENCTVVGVVCQPDRDDNKLPPTKEIALQYNIPVFQPEKIRDNYQAVIDFHADIIITCAYGQIIPKAILDTPRFGCINVHASLLPKLRGGAPIHHAIINGYSKTGITIMFMNERMDAGNIISQKEIEILPTDNVGILHDRLSLLGRDFMLETLPDIISGNINPIKQNEMDATFAPTIKRENEHIDFSKSSYATHNLIRGLNPWPGAYCMLENKILKVWDSRVSYEVYPTNFNGEIVRLYEDGIGVKDENGEIILTEVQLEGHKRMSTKDFLNGLKNRDLLIGKIFD
jgi:methionyl-tRNA formyltransferase